MFNDKGIISIIPISDKITLYSKKYIFNNFCHRLSSMDRMDDIPSVHLIQPKDFLNRRSRLHSRFIGPEFINSVDDEIPIAKYDENPCVTIVAEPIPEAIEVKKSTDIPQDCIELPQRIDIPVAEAYYIQIAIIIK